MKEGERERRMRRNSLYLYWDEGRTAIEARQYADVATEKETSPHNSDREVTAEVEMGNIQSILYVIYIIYVKYRNRLVEMVENESTI